MSDQGKGAAARPLRTIDVARRCGIHPNTVRIYEALGYLPPVPRTPSGYRQFADRHVVHVMLACAAMKSTWLGGAIRRTAIQALRAAARGDLILARSLAAAHLELIGDERRRARAACRTLDRWAEGRASRPLPRALTSTEAAARLGASPDRLRNWERNGLIVVPRHPTSRHRRYGAAELARLGVIRTLCGARFSLMAILRMLRRFDVGQRDGLSQALHQLGAGEDDLFFSADRWLVRITQIERISREFGRRLRTLQ